jgi:hypothetical protein
VESQQCAGQGRWHRPASGPGRASLAEPAACDDLASRPGRGRNHRLPLLRPVRVFPARRFLCEANCAAVSVRSGTVKLPERLAIQVRVDPGAVRCFRAGAGGGVACEVTRGEAAAPSVAVSPRRQAYISSPSQHIRRAVPPACSLLKSSGEAFLAVLSNGKAALARIDDRAVLAAFPLQQGSINSQTSGVPGLYIGFQEPESNVPADFGTSEPRLLTHASVLCLLKGRMAFHATGCADKGHRVFSRDRHACPSPAAASRRQFHPHRPGFGCRTDDGPGRQRCADPV